MNKSTTSPRKSPDLVGQRFNRLVVIEQVARNKYNQVQWSCVCDCGGTIITPTHRLQGGNTQSCGCLCKERTRAALTTHGMSDTITYIRWRSMINRCRSKHPINWNKYGARGITVCERWEKSFENFFADMGECPEHGTLDRIDNDKGYSPDNCRWATQTEQARNTRRTHFITYDGRTQCDAAWAEELGLSESTFHQRLWKGWPMERIVNTPPKR